jgi:lipase
VHRFGAPDGAPLLALHGVTGHGTRFRRLAEEGLPERRVIAPDLRGHGRSTWAPPWNAARLVTDLVELLDAEGLERTDVMGHSYGGLLATHLTARVPDRIGRVLLLDPAIAIPAEDASEAAEDTRLDDGWASEEEAYAARREGRPTHTLPMVDEDLAMTLDEGPDGRFRMRYSRPAVVTAWGEMAAPPASLAAWGGELLLVPAAWDDYVGDNIREALRRDLGDRFTERPVEGGHVLYWDAFEETVAAIRPFLVPQD